VVTTCNTGIKSNREQKPLFVQETRDGCNKSSLISIACMCSWASLSDCALRNKGEGPSSTDESLTDFSNSKFDF
jgi:hypothetical protein